MGVGDEQWAGQTGGGGGELVAVDQRDALLDGVDAERGVGDVEERQRRQDRGDDAVVVAQHPYRAFEHERRTGDGVEDLAVHGGRGDEPLGDLGVDVGERVSVLVDVVERRRRAEQSGRWMARRAQEAVLVGGDGIERLAGDVPRVAGPEADDRDTWPGRHVVVGVVVVAAALSNGSTLALAPSQ